MLTPRAPGKDPFGRLSIAVLAIVMGGFLVTSLVVQRASADIEALSGAIVSVSAPSIEHLASMRSAVPDVELTLSRLLREGPAAASRSTRLDGLLASLNDDMQGYLGLPLLRDEEPYWREIHEALVRFDDAVRRTREDVRTGATAKAQEEFAEDVEPAGRQLITAALSAIEFHARDSRSFASDMRDARRRALQISHLLSALCVVFGIAGLMIILVQARRHQALANAYSRFHEARADEYEQFAGRVAHDLRNPLCSAQMAAELALERAEGTGQKENAARILRALSHAASITTGLLEFARSGARPEPGARTDPRKVIESLGHDVATEATRLHVDVQVEPIPPVLVACSPGVYMSLVGNLVQNAIKYMGPSDARRVTVRVSEQGSSVRTEVADTGPGIAAENLPSLFEPYFRLGHDRGKEGLGLGLATVKKLVEGHGGQIGVTSEPGNGSTFWFELPRAGTAWTAAEP
jgi:signal transduction histidine kinase